MSDQENVLNRRKYPRYTAPICYRSAPFFSSRKPLVNIGLGGMRIYSDDQFKLGKRLEIELLLPNDEILRFTAKVVWQHPLPQGSVAAYDVGLQFLDIPQEGIERLSKVLEHEPLGSR
ncbi:MAG: PilZ domain-containing protein [Candidatus Vecturithrix sp.]|jgi:Tfp pilus assembly protein PilZ|nr:PilZ domain-containing protein [Candidatus Vecturithrix sp.]